MTLEKIEEKLCDLLIKDKQEVVVSLSGEWGTGKTHFWKNIFLKKNKKALEDRKIAYVSLFGASSIEEIKTSIALQVSPIKKKITQISKKYASGVDTVLQATTGIGGFSQIFSVLTENDFKDVLVCFDDFERISSKVDLKDVLGFISELKEQKECSILMILNEKELENLSSIENKKYSKIFALYKEKIIDFELFFEPTVEESFDLAIKDIETKFEKEIIKQVLLKFEIKNIRVIRQIVNKLNDFSFVNEQGYNQKVLEDFLYTTISIFDFMLENNLTIDTYLELREKNYTTNMPDEEFSKLNTKSDEYNFFIRIDESVENVIVEYLLKQEFTERVLKNTLDEKNSNLQRYTIERKIHNFWHQFHVDFKYSREHLIKDLSEIFLDYKEDLHNILNITDFHSYMVFINDSEIKFDNNSIDEIIKNYIDTLIEHEKSLDIHERRKQTFIKENYPHLIGYWNDSQKKELVDKITIEKVMEIFDKISDGWGEKDQYVLNNVDSKVYQDYIEISSSFTKKIIYFLNRHKNDTKYFKEAIQNIKKALSSLSMISEDYKFKVDKIIKETGITLNET